MRNPYIVSISLSGASTLLSTDEDQNTVHFEWTERGDPNRMHVFNIAKKIWIREFELSDKAVNEMLDDDKIMVVVYSKDKTGSLKPLSAGRFQCEGDDDKSAHISAVASIEKRQGYGRLLLENIGKLVKARYNCNFMTVDVTRPIISKTHWIKMFMNDPVEANFWARENSFEHGNIESMKRTTRVQGLLDFYKECDFKFQIKPKKDSFKFTLEEEKCTEEELDLMNYPGGCDCTPWGFIEPFISYRLVAKLCKTDDASVTPILERLSEWRDYKDLQDNYDSY